VGVVLTTHYMEEAERLADHVVIIDHGRVVADGPTAALTRGDRELRSGLLPDWTCLTSPLPFHRAAASPSATLDSTRSPALTPTK